MIARSPIPGATARYAWVAGRIVPVEQARVSIFDRGFLYGDAFFETVRVYRGRPFLWQGHLRRLRASLRTFAVPWPRHDLRAAALALLDACSLDDAAVRVTVTRGAAEGLVPPRGLAPTAVITARTIPESLVEERARGISVIRLPFGHGRGGVASGHKNVDYLPAVAGRMRAAQRGATEALFVEADGTISEGTTSNLFVVRRGRLLTPPTQAGCLPGLTRQVVERLAERAGVAVRETPIAARELGEADEVFLTGTVIEVLPVVRIDGRRIASGRPGPITLRLQQLYRSYVERSLGRAAAPARSRASRLSRLG